MRKLNSLILILFAYFLLAPAGMAQENLSQAKILAYLKREGVLQKYDALLKDEPLALPKKLSEALQFAFPKHRFTHIRLEASTHSVVAIPADFVLVSDANSGEITGFVSSTYSVASDSFKNLLASYRAASEEEALNKVLILSELIAYPEDSCVGRVFLKGGVINAELISTFEPYLILKVKVDRGFKFGRDSVYKSEEW
jgi:hypothetical protein